MKNSENVVEIGIEIETLETRTAPSGLAALD